MWRMTVLELAREQDFRCSTSLDGARKAVELRRHDEIVLVQALDLLGAQRCRRIAPAETDIWMVAFGLGQCGGALDKAKASAKFLSR